MPLQECLVILNPASDRGRAARAGAAAMDALLAAGVRAELATTDRRGHATEIARAAASERGIPVLAVGGDGLVHEVVNGLLLAAGGASSAPLGVVPMGSGNDFAKMLGIPPRRPREAVTRILTGRPRGVDVGWVRRCVAERGRAGEWAFVNGLGIGFDAQVAAEASRIRRLRGLAIYVAALARTLPRLRAPRMRIAVDGREVADRPLLLATIANGGCHGGGFWLCPDARIDDGALDVLTADPKDAWEAVRLALRVLRGAHLGAPGVFMDRGARVQVWSEEPLPVHADGEIVVEGVRELEVEILPGRLTVLA